MNIANAIQLGILLGQAAAIGIPAARDAAARIENMVREGRDPTPEEWDALNQHGAEMRRRILSA